MQQTSHDADARFICSEWLPAELAANVQPWAAGLLAMSAVAVEEILGQEVVGFEARVLTQQPILFALAVGHDWARQTIRTPLDIEERVTVALMRHIEVVATAGPDVEHRPGIPHGRFAIDLFREVSQLWHDSLPTEAIQDVLADRQRLVARIAECCVDAPDRDLRLPSWFDVGVAHAHFDRILTASAAADGDPLPRPTLDPISWVWILDPEVFTEPSQPGPPPRARRLR